MPNKFLVINKSIECKLYGITIAHKSVDILTNRINKQSNVKVICSDSETDLAIYLLKTKDISTIHPLLSEKFPDIQLPDPEGYSLSVNNHGVLICGIDDRGLMYGVGKLLRKIEFRKSELTIEYLVINSNPQNEFRGHQLGYRPKTNAYDAWSKDQYKTYIEDLILFGANGIEILPPRTDDDADGPLLKYDPLEMMVYLSELISSYYIDVWIWYPNMGTDYTDSELVLRELEERAEIFKRLPTINHLFIPGGDPGEMEPDNLFAHMSDIASILKKDHPDAKIWISPQSFKEQKSWVDGFIDHINRKPDWLGGVVFAPWVRTSIKELRSRVSKDIPIRRYPDITHSYACQYPDIDWDLPYALTLGRECINPRPEREKKIHNIFSEYANGSVSYSEGINDDLNKFVWSDQDWDKTINPRQTVEEYCSVFISSAYKRAIADGIYALEKNLYGPMISNMHIDTSLAYWKNLEKSVPVNIRENYRFQLFLLRAYYDAFIKIRLIHETAQFSGVMALLDDKTKQTDTAIEECLALLRKTPEQVYSLNYREKCFMLADSLFEKIGAQLTVEKHKGIAWNRGAFLDAIDIPLTSSEWLIDNLECIAKLPQPADRGAALEKLTYRKCPEPGTKYINFGEPGSLSYVIDNYNAKDYNDPGVLRSPFIAYATPLLYEKGKDGVKGITKNQYEEYGPVPLEWVSTLTTLYDTPLKVRINNLDPDKDYVLKVAYVGIYYITDWGGTAIKLIADKDTLIHDYYDITGKCEIKEYQLPRKTTCNGMLELCWSTRKGEQGPNIAELWLIPKPESDGNI